MVILNRVKSNEVYKKVYQLWRNMTQRCLNPKNPYYKNYGGKGATICKKWIELDGFIEDIDKINGFNTDDFLNGKLSLDKDFYGENIYSLNTCRFISKEENNKIKPNQQIKFIAISPSGEKTVWVNQSECARKNGLSQTRISENLRNPGKKYRGWEFIPFK